MTSYSIDLRERVLAACDRREGTRERIAQRFCVSSAWVDRLLARRRDTGSIAPKPHGGGQRPAFQGDTAERLRKAVEDCPDATLEELRQAAGVDCGTSAAFRALRRLGLPRKKSRSGPPSRTGRSRRPSARRGGPSSPTSTRTGWCWWTRPARTPRWPAATAAPRAAGGSTARCRMATGRR